MISHDLKFIFIHIPKTAGNSLALFLKDHVANEVILRESSMGPNQGIDIICEINSKDIKHKPISYYNNLYKSKIDDYYKFTIVRNPYDRLLSFYFWQKGKNHQTFNKEDFKQFIYRNQSYQHTYIWDSTLNKIDPTVHIIRFEDLINGLKETPPLKDFDFEKDYPHINASTNTRLDWTKLYDQELRDLVYKKYKRDFIFFNYEETPSIISGTS